MTFYLEAIITKNININFKKSFFETVLGVTPYWDYKSFNAIHADNPGVYTSEKLIKLNTIERIYLNCDANEGSAVNGIRQ